MARVLNRKETGLRDAPTKGVIAGAGRVDGGILERLRRDYAAAFGNQRQPELLPEAGTLPGEAVVAYACLIRELPFKMPFARLEGLAFVESPLTVYGDEYAALQKRKHLFFGIRELWKGGPLEAERAKQVRVLWHRFLYDKDATGISERFVVELKARSGEDRIILAKIDPALTIGETVRTAVSLMIGKEAMPASKPGPEPDSAPADLQEEGEIEADELSKVPTLTKWDSLEIPVLNLNVLKDYDELCGRRIRSGNPRLDGLELVLARQLIRFRLNEGGAYVESEAVLDLLGEPFKRHFSFDSPFLVMLMKGGASYPYFALWVGNDELITRG